MRGYAAATSLMLLHRPPRHERVLLCAFPQTAPAFPITLLEKRDNGNVVFFCGAGVSRPTGLSGFVGLAEQTIAKLGATADAKSRLLLKRALQGANCAPPLDQIFQHLQQEYGAALVEDTVNAPLATPQNPNTDHHSTIGYLSRMEFERRPGFA